jgi:hypothetical protein
VTFARLLYLVGQGPRIWSLLRQLWSILVESSDERVLEYIGTIESLTRKLKESKDHETRAAIAHQFSDLIRKL